VLGMAVIVFWPAAVSGLGAPIRHLAGIGSDHAAAEIDHVRRAAVPESVPGPNSTGWQHTSVTLTPTECVNGELVIDTDGTVLDGAQVDCDIRIDANDVTISRSLIRAGGPWAIYKPDRFTNLTVRDVEIAGQPGCQAALVFSHFTATRLNVHGCADGLRVDQNATVQDSWIHDFWDGRVNGQQVGAVAHDGVSMTGGSDLTIRHNRIDNPRSNDSCITIGDQFGAPSNVVIEGNYLDGGNYTIALAPAGANRVIRDNTFTRAYLTAPAKLGGSYTWAGNVYTDGSPVTG
jgi:hypothetical protein